MQVRRAVRRTRFPSTGRTTTRIRTRPRRITGIPRIGWTSAVGMETAADKMLTKVALNVYRELLSSEGESEEGVEEEEQMAENGRGSRGRGTAHRSGSRIPDD